MTERELRARLRSAPLPRQGAGEERAWQVVRAADVAASRPGARRRIPRCAGLLVACGLALVAVVLATGSPPHGALARWLAQAIGFTNVPPARDTLAGVPGGGRLLVSTGDTDWILTSGATRRRLGHYDGAQLSPHGLYVAAWRGNEIGALTPRGNPAWTRTAPATVTLARWSADGYRIAYLAGGSVRVLAGDGSNDHDVVDHVAPVAPAWQPATGVAHRLALLDGAGALELRDDSGALIWSRRPRIRPNELLWSSDGRFLAGIRADRLVLYNAHGRIVGALTAPPGASVEHVAFAPAGGDRLAFVLHRRLPVADSVEVVDGTPAGLRRAPVRLVTLPERISGLAWSPGGDRLLSASPASDQWIAIGTRPPFSLMAIGQIERRFAAPGATSRTFPAPVAWRG